jgi:putative FmdB family regulatory protein
MPIYDFKCECGETRTITISIPPGDFKMSCVCGKEMKKVFGIGAVTFKGTGWGKDKN